jgi:hypothetical protein
MMGFILRAPNKEFFFARPTNNFFSFSSPPFESDWGRGRLNNASKK